MQMHHPSGGPELQLAGVLVVAMTIFKHGAEDVYAADPLPPIASYMAKKPAPFSGSICMQHQRHLYMRLFNVDCARQKKSKNKCNPPLFLEFSGPQP